MTGAQKEEKMSKITKIMSATDKIIDGLIDDKNRLYMKNKRLEKENEILKTQKRHVSKKFRALEKKYKELVNEKLQKIQK